MALRPASRNLRRVSVPCHAVLSLFAHWRQCDHVRLPVMVLPDGAVVHDVREDFLSKSFDFLVEHPSFDPVPDGAEFPRHPCDWEDVVIGGRLAHQLAEAAKLYGAPWEDRGVTAELVAECKRVAAAGRAFPALSEADRVRAQLDAELDHGPRRALLALADVEGEQGRADLAAGYRWLAENGRWPELDAVNRRWHWAGGYRDEEVAYAEQPRPYLPRGAYGLLPRAEPESPVLGDDGLPDTLFGYPVIVESKPGPFPTASEALRAGAAAVGAWLLGSEVKE